MKKSIEVYEGRVRDGFTIHEFTKRDDALKFMMEEN
jgi:hypothetical protein